MRILLLSILVLLLAAVPVLANLQGTGGTAMWFDIDPDAETNLIESRSIIEAGIVYRPIVYDDGATIRARLADADAEPVTRPSRFLFEARYYERNATLVGVGYQFAEFEGVEFITKGFFAYLADNPENTQVGGLGSLAMQAEIGNQTFAFEVGIGGVAGDDRPLKIVTSFGFMTP